MNVTFKVIGGRSATVNVRPTATVLQVKEQLASIFGIYPVQQSLIYKGVKLDEKRTLESYRLSAGGVINIMASKLPPFHLKLSQYFSSLSECQVDVAMGQFSRLYQDYLDSLNLEDIEILCKKL